MPSVIAPPGFAIGELIWTLTGDNEEMIVTIGMDVTAAGGDADAVADELYLAYAGAFPAGAEDNEYTFQGTRVVFGADGGGGAQGEHIQPRAGTAAISPLPNNTAVLVRKVTGFSGRRNRGRFYFPPMWINESLVGATGVIDAATVTALQTNLNSMYTFMTVTASPSIPPVLLHSSAPLTPTAITSFSLENRVATQRRRLRR